MRRTMVFRWMLIAISVIALVACGRLMGVHYPSTGANVTPNAVRFLKLPSSASNVGFWDDGYQRLATFNIPEKDFVRVFSGEQFTAFTNAKSYAIWAFGDPRHSPTQSASIRTATSGLFYEQRWSNGGGCTIVFDRERQCCSYEFARW